MLSLSITSNMAKYEKDLAKMRRTSVPGAVRWALNSMAFEARSEGQSNIRDQMILRNKFTASRVFVDKATGRDIDRMRSVTGSPLDYLATQEEGGYSKPERGDKKPIPTPTASREGDSRPRRKLPRGAHRLRNIELKHLRNIRHMPRRQKNAVQVAIARREGYKYVYLNLGRQRGIFKVMGTKRRPRIRMLYDLRKDQVRIHSRPWLKPAAEKAGGSGARAYRKFLADQLRQFRTWEQGL